MGEGSGAPSVLVIGAQGVLGNVLSAELVRQGWRVTRAGRRPEGGEDFLQLDLDDEAALAAAIDAAAIVVNTAHHPPLAPERVALERGATLLDLTDLSLAERTTLREIGNDAEGLVIPDAGLSGVAYLALAELIARHPDADAASYALMFSAEGTSGRAGALLGHGLLTDARHHETERIELPDPWGPTRVIEVAAGRLLGSLPEAICGVRLRHYLSLQPRLMQAALLGLNGARLISLLPTFVFTAGLGGAPAEPSEEPICERVAIHRGGSEIAAMTTSGRGYYRMTAAAIVSFAEALLAIDCPLTGLRSIEEAISLEELAGPLAERGISVSEQT